MTATDERTKLMQRLEHGYMLINEANDAGDLIEKQRLEDHWIGLLSLYESAEDDTAFTDPRKHENRTFMVEARAKERLSESPAKPTDDAGAVSQQSLPLRGHYASVSGIPEIREANT